MKRLQITPIGAYLSNVGNRISDRAKLSLDKFANDKVKEEKLTTKVFKYGFPFYDMYYVRQAFKRFCKIIQKAFEKNIPYVTTLKVPYLETPNTGSAPFVIRIGDLETRKYVRIERYLRFLHRQTRRQELPFSYQITRRIWLDPRGMNTYGGYNTEEERTQNTLQIVEIRVTLNRDQVRQAYNMFFHIRDIMKVLSTLHRLADYDQRIPQ